MSDTFERNNTSNNNNHGSINPNNSGIGPSSSPFLEFSMEPPTRSEAPVFRSAVRTMIDPSTILAQEPRSATVEKKEFIYRSISNSDNKQKTDTRTADTTTTTSTWNTQNPIVVPKMPAYYPLSRAHYKFPKTGLATMLSIISETLRLLSLATIFFNSPAALAATCRSMSGVELKVQFFECKEDDSQVVLEVSRVNGDTIEYCGLAKKILAACQKQETATSSSAEDQSSQSGGGSHGGEEEEESAKSHRGRVFDAILRRLPVPEPENDAIQESLELALGMLLTDRYDARYLGLQSLVYLCDPSKTFRPVAIAAAKAVLLGKFQCADGTTITDTRIQERIFSLALCGRWPDTPLENCDNEGYASSVKPHAHLALMVVANAASLLENKSEFATFLEHAADMTAGTSLILAMQERVWNARMEPHTAYLATRILACICQGQPDAVRSCSRFQTDAVRVAQHVGQTSHAALEAESGQLLVALHALAA